MKVISC